MNKPSFASSERKVYRFNLFYQWYHFVVGAVFLGVAVAVHDFLILSIGIALFAVFMISRPLLESVIVDQYSVTVKGIFRENSVQRSSITAIETVSIGKGPLLMLWTNVDQKKGLAIAVNLFAFDEEWDEWLSSYRDLSDSKPLSLFPPGQR